MQAEDEDREDSELLVDLNLRGPALAASWAGNAVVQGSRLSRASLAELSAGARNTSSEGQDTMHAAAGGRHSEMQREEWRAEAAEAGPPAGGLPRLKRLRRAGDAAQPAGSSGGPLMQADSGAEGARRRGHARRSGPAEWSEADSDDSRHRMTDSCLVSARMLENSPNLRQQHTEMHRRCWILTKHLACIQAGPSACADTPRNRANPFVSKAFATMGMVSKLKG